MTLPTYLSARVVDHVPQGRKERAACTRYGKSKGGRNSFCGQQLLLVAGVSAGGWGVGGGGGGGGVRYPPTAALEECLWKYVNTLPSPFLPWAVGVSISGWRVQAAHGFLLLLS